MISASAKSLLQTNFHLSRPTVVKGGEPSQKEWILPVATSAIAVLVRGMGDIHWFLYMVLNLSPSHCDLSPSFTFTHFPSHLHPLSPHIYTHISSHIHPLSLRISTHISLPPPTIINPRYPLLPSLPPSLPIDGGFTLLYTLSIQHHPNPYQHHDVFDRVSSCLLSNHPCI